MTRRYAAWVDRRPWLSLVVTVVVLEIFVGAVASALTWLAWAVWS